eukprot:m.1309068 g.1309068  ORF g.1309068 m.1309068 type:complete len:831 (-) comp24823_c0_seq7:2074-4566(-)
MTASTVVATWSNIIFVCSAAAAYGTTIDVSPSDCIDGNCYSAISNAVARCTTLAMNAQKGCSVVLQPQSTYKVLCPHGDRPSSAQTEFPAILIANATNFTFGGPDGCNKNDRPLLQIDYTNGGCTAIKVLGGARNTIRNLNIDTLRLPFTLGHVVSNKNNGMSISFTLEDQLAYNWDLEKYSWISVSFASAVVPLGHRATRQLPEANLNDFVSSYRDAHNSALVTLEFNKSDKTRGTLQHGDRIFLKHFANMQSWGPYGFQTTNLTIRDTALWSVGGMGYRCDFCSGVFSMSDAAVELKPGTNRPMSTTADATHFMHHRGSIELTRVSVQGQGDDGFNVHGNFVVVQDIVNSHTVHYIDESGPGWVTAAPTYLIGDTVQFYARGSLHWLQSNRIVNASTDTVTFAQPLPSTLQRFDMFISSTRTSALTVKDSFFGNSNSRGLVISAVGVRIENTTFSNLPLSAVLFMEGGCGAIAGDYTEGPFSRDIILQNNTFDGVSDVVPKYPFDIVNMGMVQLAGCVPLGRCGGPTGVPEWARPVGAAVSNAGQSHIVRTIGFTLAGPSRVTSLALYLQTRQKSLGGLQVAIYNSSGEFPTWGPKPHPTQLLASVDVTGWTGNTSAYADGWNARTLAQRIVLGAGNYFLAFYYTGGGPWLGTIVPQGVQPLGFYASLALPTTNTRLPATLASHSLEWKMVRGAQLAMRLSWEPEGAWCDVGGTLPPVIQTHPGDTGAGRLSEHGQLVRNTTIYTDVVVRDNVFVQHVRPWLSSALHVGAVSNLLISGNSIHVNGTAVANQTSDFVVYASTDVTISNNRCWNGTREKQRCIVQGVAPY